MIIFMVYLQNWNVRVGQRWLGRRVIMRFIFLYRVIYIYIYVKIARGRYFQAIVEAIYLIEGINFRGKKKEYFVVTEYSTIINNLKLTTRIFSTMTSELPYIFHSSSSHLIFNNYLFFFLNMCTRLFLFEVILN